jgi:hypothetical protein
LTQVDGWSTWQGLYNRDFMMLDSRKGENVGRRICGGRRNSSNLQNFRHNGPAP